MVECFLDVEEVVSSSLAVSTTSESRKEDLFKQNVERQVALMIGQDKCYVFRGFPKGFIRNNSSHSCYEGKCTYPTMVNACVAQLV